ncbi:hypothetical protein GBAR_LOCUS9555 [Geodia barretti]|uniref:Uncharacterized protein n=1 Tax=Geodia barretti TaxID=519541 RepID=A0AA35WID0_GEOBA|nr:hypothetical protein GBAR_LOCUS9555 [Geodia barretti]
MSQELNATLKECGCWWSTGTTYTVVRIIRGCTLFKANTTSKPSRFQAVLVTDGTKSYCLFIYHCDFLRFSGAAVGFSASGNFFFNHRHSRSSDSKEVACSNRPDSDWNTLVYALHYDGMKK